MASNQSREDFVRRGPRINNTYLLEEAGGNFSVRKQIANAIEPTTVLLLDKVAVAMNRMDFLEAAVRFEQIGNRMSELFREEAIKANFNPSQPRNYHGEWTDASDNRNRPAKGQENARQHAVTDPYCKIVKELCIVEATGALPTKDDGFSFFNVLNSCMDRHGCLGRA